MLKKKKKSNSTACKTERLKILQHRRDNIEVWAEFGRECMSSFSGSTACCLCNLGKLTFCTPASLSMKWKQLCYSPNRIIMKISSYIKQNGA